MRPWLLRRLVFDPYAFVHKQDASFAFESEQEAIQEFARQFAERPDQCMKKVFVVSNAERATRKFWIATNLRVSDLEAKEPNRIITEGFRTTPFQADLRDMPAYVTSVAVVRPAKGFGPRFGAASVEDAKDRASLLCLEDFVRVEIHERRSLRRVGRVTMTDVGPAFTPAQTPNAQPVQIRPRQVDEVLRFAGVEERSIC